MDAWFYDLFSSMSIIQADEIVNNERLCNLWMTGNFMTLSTVFQAYEAIV